MAIRKIRVHPDPCLRETTQLVTSFDDELARLLNDMAETMYAAPGIGLAATQIGVALQVFVIDVATGVNERSDLRVFINPQLLERSGDVRNAEGCLSIPGVQETVPRAERVRVRAQDARGEVFEYEADGLLAHALQHEDDHIRGTLFIDHLSALRRRMALRALKRSE